MSRSGSRAKLSSSGSRSSLKDKGNKRRSEEDDGGEVTVASDVDQLAWKVLGRRETADLAGMDETQMAKKLAGVLGMTHYEENLSEAALVDYYVATYWFAREHKFTDEQTSVLFTIVHTLITNIKDQCLSLPDNIQQLRGMLAGVGVSQQTAVQCLTPQTARLVVECITTSLFQHYHLFQCLFEDQQSKLQIDSQVYSGLVPRHSAGQGGERVLSPPWLTERLGTKLPVEVPPPHTTLCPPPLDEAIPLELYERCLAPQPAVKDEEQLESEETDAEQMSPVMSNLTEKESELLLRAVSPEELKSLMVSLTSDTLSTYQAEVFKKLQDKEKAFISRLSKLEKSLT